MTLAEIILFGGTTEGRELAQALDEAGLSALVCVATEYGASLLPPMHSVTVHTGRLDADAMAALFQAEAPRLVIDATHPYASEVSQAIQKAAHQTGLPSLRIQREETAAGDCLTFPSLNDLIGWLNGTTDVIFSALGAKEASALAQVTGAKERIWLRILPLEESLQAVRAAGFPAKHTICMQGPFSQALNEAMFRAAGAKILLTKASGTAGGMEDKLRAARACGMTIALLARPMENGITLEACKKRIREGRL